MTYANKLENENFKKYILKKIKRLERKLRRIEKILFE